MERDPCVARTLGEDESTTDRGGVLPVPVSLPALPPLTAPPSLITLCLIVAFRTTRFLIDGESTADGVFDVTDDTVSKSSDTVTIALIFFFGCFVRGLGGISTRVKKRENTISKLVYTAIILYLFLSV